MWIAPTEEEIREKHFKSIIRKHGNRIVKASESISMHYKTKLIITDMESMVKISDQCNIPIFILDEGGMPKENSLFLYLKKKYAISII